MLFNASQPEKTFSPKLATLLGMLMVVRLLQFLYANGAMFFTPLGILMLVRLLQFSKALYPILFIPLAKVISVRLLHPEKV